MIESIEKLREASHIDDGVWTLEDGGVVYMCGSMPNDPNAVNWGEQWREIADEIEAEVERDYMPKPKVEKNFSAIDDGVTDIAVALGNIAECNAARASMGQEITYHDVDVILGSIAAIADAYYMRLPVDADGVPIHVGDYIRGDDEYRKLAGNCADYIGEFIASMMAQAWRREVRDD